MNSMVTYSRTFHFFPLLNASVTLSSQIQAAISDEIIFTNSLLYKNVTMPPVSNSTYFSFVTVLITVTYSPNFGHGSLPSFQIKGISALLLYHHKIQLYIFEKMTFIFLKYITYIYDLPKFVKTFKKKTRARRTIGAKDKSDVTSQKI